MRANNPLSHANQLFLHAHSSYPTVLFIVKERPSASKEKTKKNYNATNLSLIFLSLEGYLLCPNFLQGKYNLTIVH